MELTADTQGRRMPRKRVITDARREQNRVAQLAYRRRQKEARLQKKAQSLYKNPPTRGTELELRPKEPRKTGSAPTSTVQPEDGAPETRTHLLSGTSSASDAVRNSVQPSAQVESEQIASGSNHMYGTDKPRLYPLPILKSSTFFPAIDYSTPQLSIGSDFLVSRTFDSMDPSHNFAPDSALFAGTDLFGLPEQDDISQSSFTFPDQIGTTAPFVSDDPSTINGAWEDVTKTASLAKPAISSRPTMASGRSATWDVTMPFPARAIGVEDIVAAGMQVLLFNRPSHPSARRRIQSAESSFNLPSPYRNTLDIPRTRTLSACLYNAHSMGFAISDVIKPFCIAPSLFYRSHAPGDDLTALVASASASNPGMPENLQPTLQQVLHPHPAFLDLIPIPSFRDKVIMAAVKRGWERVGPGGLNLFELKRDIFQDGLSWQSPEIYGDKGEKVEPWDMMSWEASGWFVRKWSCLIDDAVTVSE